tara:strand:- start:35 stop:238 length:204 start_codon:yes stop_codon:yes gene_type:complete
LAIKPRQGIKRWHDEGGAELIVHSAMPALGKMSQDDVNAALSALVEPALMGLKKPIFQRRIAGVYLS